MEQRNESGFLYKVWEVLKPFVIYYVTYNVAFLLIAYLCNAAMEYFGTGLQEYVIGHADTVTELVNGISMLISVLPLMPMLRKELTVNRKSMGSGVRQKVLAAVITVILAATSSVGFNILLSLTGFVQTSATYQDVAKQQYSVVFGVGAILFGLISPIAEEIVFRGLVFNRMRRYSPTMVAIIVSSVLFGVYHGNLVQGVYGTCMGILLAYTYERMRSFLVPCLFHAVANIMVYTLTYAQSGYESLQTALFKTPNSFITLGVLLVVSVVCVMVISHTGRKSG